MGEEAPRYYKADEGMVFQRIFDEVIFGSEIWLGNRFDEKGKAIREEIEDYRQIPQPIDNEEDR